MIVIFPIDKRKGAGAFSSGRRVVNSPGESEDWRSLGMFWPSHTWAHGDWYDEDASTPEHASQHYASFKSLIFSRGFLTAHDALGNFLEPMWSNQDWYLSILQRGIKVNRLIFKIASQPVSWQRFQHLGCCLMFIKYHILHINHKQYSLFILLGGCLRLDRSAKTQLFPC